MKHDRLKKFFSMLLCLCMVLGCLPSAAYATETACTCTTACTTESINTACPVCGVEGADLETCAQHVHAQELEETTVPTEATKETTAPTESEDTMEPEMDEAVVAVQTMIDALPEVGTATDAELTAAYDAAQTAYDAYEALTAEQQAMVDITRLVAFMDWYNGQPETLDSPTDGTCGTNVNWSYADGTLTISGSGSMDALTANEVPWQSFRSSLTKVVIVAGVTSIGNNAFYGFYNLVSVTIPDSVTSIGEYAFDSCTRLSSATIPDSVTSIGKRAFYDCESLPSVTFPSSIKTIGDWAFANCDKLTTVTIPDSVKRIEARTFGYCKNLKSVTIGSGVTNIGMGAFGDCPNLDSIAFTGTKSPSYIKETITPPFCGIASDHTLTVPAGYPVENGFCGLTVTNIEGIHYHGVNGNGEKVQWTPIKKLSDINAPGNYCLDNGFEIEFLDQTINAGGTVNLCLNGITPINCPTVTDAFYDVEISAGTTVNIYDCGTYGNLNGKILNSGTVNLFGGTLEKQFENVSGANATLNVNGGTIGGYVTNNGGTVTISNGTVVGVNNKSNGTLTISGGTISNSADGNSNLITNDGTLTISGGEITANHGNAICHDGGTATITGGTISSTDSDYGYSTIHTYGGTLTIIDGTFKNIGKNTESVLVAGRSDSSGGEIIVNGGTFESIGSIAYAFMSDLTINGGDFTGVNEDGSGMLISNATLNINGGTFKKNGTGAVVLFFYNDGKANIKGGTFENGIGTIESERTDDRYLNSVLPQGYGFYDENGTLVTLTNEQRYINETVTVKEKKVEMSPVYVGGVQLALDTKYVNSGNSVAESTDESCNAIVTKDASGNYTLTINGLNVTGIAATAGTWYDWKSSGIFCEDVPLTIVVEGASTVKGADAANNSAGVYSAESLTIVANAKFTAIGGTASASNASSSGIQGNNSVTLSGTITATGGEADGTSCGVFGYYVSVTGENTLLTATGGKSNGYRSLGMDSSNQMTLNGGKIVAKCGEGKLTGDALDHVFKTDVAGKKVKYATSDGGEATETRPTDAAYVIVTLGTPDPVYYTVTFNTDGGVVTGEGITEVKPNQQYTTKYQQGILATLPTAEAVHKDGYVFAGWKDDNGPFDNVVSIGPKNTENLTFTAKWKRLITDAVITLGDDPTYNGNERTIEIKSVELDGKTLIPGDYVVISGNTGTNADTYTLTIQGMGNYSGTATKEWKILKASQTAPTVGKTDETIWGKNDGSITGLTNKMEYRQEGETAYTAASGEKLENLAPGKYYVRYAGDNNHDPSPDQEIVIAKGKKLTITLPMEQMGYSLTSIVPETEYNGSITLNFELKPGYSKGQNFAITASNGVVEYSYGRYILSGVTENTVISVTGVVDITGPEVQISVSDNHWKEFLNTITFDHFFKETQTVTITAEDKGSGVDTISYYLSKTALTLERVKALADADWTKYANKFSISNERQYVIYAKVTDQAGNTTYISSDGLILDMTAPVISGVENGKTYYTTQKVTANDTYLESLAGVETDGMIPGDVDKTYTVEATDKAGNSTTFTITMKPISSIREGLPTMDTVKITDKAAIETIKATATDVLTNQCANATDAEKAKLDQIIKDCDALLAAIRNAEDAIELIGAMPDASKTQPDDKTAIDAYEAAKAAYDKLTDAEKRMVGKENKEKLDAMFKALTAYDIIKGDGGKWTKGSSSGLSFTANGYYGKFTGIKVDGETVDAKNYEAQSGSTVITLKASYLQTLKTSKHTIQVLYTDGATDGADTFTIKAASTPGNNSTTNGVNSPGTGDHSNMVLWISLLCVSAAGMVALLWVNRKRRTSK